MFAAALFTIRSTGRSSQCPSMVDWVEMCCGILFTMKNKETLPLVRTWMNLEGIMLREVSETEKDEYHMISLTYGS